MTAWTMTRSWSACCGSSALALHGKASATTILPGSMIWMSWATITGHLAKGIGGIWMSKPERRLADLERRQPVEPQKVVIIGEDENTPVDADMVIVLCSPELDSSGRANQDE